MYRHQYTSMEWDSSCGKQMNVVYPITLHARVYSIVAYVKIFCMLLHHVSVIVMQTLFLILLKWH